MSDTEDGRDAPETEGDTSEPRDGQDAQEAEGDLIDRLPDWLVSRDEADVVSERLDRAIRFFATYFP